MKFDRGGGIVAAGNWIKILTRKTYKNPSKAKDKISERSARNNPVRSGGQA